MQFDLLYQLVIVSSLESPVLSGMNPTTGGLSKFAQNYRRLVFNQLSASRSTIARKREIKVVLSRSYTTDYEPKNKYDSISTIQFLFGPRR